MVGTAAAAFYRDLARSSDQAVRAAAIVGLARNLQTAGRIDEAFDTYSTLADQRDASIGDVPAVLVARYARGKLFESRADPERLRLEGEQLARNLRSYGSILTRPVYWLYATDAAQWSGMARDGLRQEELFGEAAVALWERWRVNPRATGSPSGRELLEVDGQTLTVLWQASGDAIRALVAAPGFVESQWLPAVAAIEQQENVFVARNDRDGRPRTMNRCGESETAKSTWPAPRSGAAPSARR